MLLISVFFLINSAISLNIEILPSFGAYIVGFFIGVVCVFIGVMFNEQRREFDATDIQIEIAVDLCKQFSAIPAKIIKGTPSEIYHLVYATKAYFPENGKSIDVVFSEVKDQPVTVA